MITNSKGPADGHQFHFVVTVQGSYQVVGDPRIVGDVPYRDCAPDPSAEPFRLTVRAWSLVEACAIAAQTPLPQWTCPCGERHADGG